MSDRPLSADQKRAREQRACDEWNRRHPVGDEVSVLLDNGVRRDTTTRSEAYVSNSGHAVIFLTGISGYYLLERVGAKAVMR